MYELIAEDFLRYKQLFVFLFNFEDFFIFKYEINCWGLPQLRTTFRFFFIFEDFLIFKDELSAEDFLG